MLNTQFIIKIELSSADREAYAKGMLEFIKSAISVRSDALSSDERLGMTAILEYVQKLQPTEQEYEKIAAA